MSAKSDESTTSETRTDQAYAKTVKDVAQEANAALGRVPIGWAPLATYRALEAARTLLKSIEEQMDDVIDGTTTGSILRPKVGA